jgi:hypothetical protein
MRAPGRWAWWGPRTGTHGVVKLGVGPSPVRVVVLVQVQDAEVGPPWGLAMGGTKPERGAWGISGVCVKRRPG